jgi:hypothetical protein
VLSCAEPLHKRRRSSIRELNHAPGERIVEKLPMNYLYLGAIHRALPQATLLLVRGSPLDSCFAMYRTLFREGYPHTP